MTGLKIVSDMHCESCNQPFETCPCGPSEEDIAVDLKKLRNWGTVHCTECDAVMSYFPPEVSFQDGGELPFYCFGCALSLNSGKH